MLLKLAVSSVLGTMPLSFGAKGQTPAALLLQPYPRQPWFDSPRKDTHTAATASPHGTSREVDPVWSPGFLLRMRDSSRCPPVRPAQRSSRLVGVPRLAHAVRKAVPARQDEEKEKEKKRIHDARASFLSTTPSPSDPSRSTPSLGLWGRAGARCLESTYMLQRINMVDPPDQSGCLSTSRQGQKKEEQKYHVDL